ncbi:MAG: ectoine/hydroxyectoine ABC transporter permease subunit EhuD [Dehalococcoidia bacterium]
MIDWQVVWDSSPALWRGLQVTMRVTLLGITLAMVLGLAWAIIRRVSPPFIRWPLIAVLEFIRSTPLLVQVYFLFFVLPAWGVTVDAFETGVIALGVHFSTYTAEVYRAGIEGVPTGQWEASTALSLSPYHKWTRIILPQAIPAVIPALGNYLIAMFKEAPLLSAITIVELLSEAQKICSRDFTCFEPYTLAGVFFLAISIPSSIFVRFLEARFVRPAA